MDRLTGDPFGVSDWAATKKAGVPDTRTPGPVSGDISILIDALKAACLKENIPMFVMLSLPNREVVEHAIGDKPENVSIGYLISRATASKNEAYIRAVVLNPDVMAQMPRNG